jgi:hypothetical protein
MTFSLQGKIPQKEKEEIDERGFCDVVFADWANHDESSLESSQSALTLYIPQPYEGANQFLFSPSAYEKHEKRILKNLGPWMDVLQLRQEDITGLRLTRYGHALPVAKTGLIANGQLELAHQSIDEMIHFAHSDNWANPCFETAFYSARQIKNGHLN